MLAGDEDGRLWSQRWRPAFGWEESSDDPAGIEHPIQAVCRTDPQLWVDTACRQVRILLARLNGNRPVAALPRAEETSVPPQLASGVHGRLYVTFADRDGTIRLAEVPEDHRQISNQWNTEKTARRFSLLAAGGASLLLAWSPDEPIGAHEPAGGQWRVRKLEIRPAGPVVLAPRWEPSCGTGRAHRVSRRLGRRRGCRSTESAFSHGSAVRSCSLFPGW